MCIQHPVSFTDLFVAQQVTLLPTPGFAASNGLLGALDAPAGIPAVIAGAASPGFVQVCFSPLYLNDPLYLTSSSSAAALASICCGARMFICLISGALHHYSRLIIR
jgi:hypothetical protein